MQKKFSLLVITLLFVMASFAQNNNSLIVGPIQSDYGNKAVEATGVKVDFPPLEILLEPAETVADPVGFR